MRELFRRLRVNDTKRNRKKYRLWVELNPRDPAQRKCPYSGVVISAEDVFFNQYCEIERIVPKDDGGGNKSANQVLCTRVANIEKGHRTAWIAWGDVQWKTLEACTIHLPREKRALILKKKPRRHISKD